MPLHRSALRALGVAVGAVALAACVPHTGQVAGPGWPTIDQPAAIHVHPFFVCTREHETPGNHGWPYEDGYTYPTRPGHPYAGAYQFDQRTWESAVTRMLGGAFALWALLPPNAAPVDVQDRAALQLANERGAQPWGGRCAEHIR